jgi:SAM-dependent methyltransferase
MSKDRRDDRGHRELYTRPRYYDHAYRALRKDIPFYTALAERCGGPVLELGAGTGRVTLGLAHAGIDVVAVDLSRDMLDRAEQRLARLPKASAARITLVQGDMRSLRLRRRFPLVIAPFNLFMHLYTRDDFELALRTVHEHLAPGGTLAFDVLMPDLGTLRRDPSRVYRCRPVFDPSDGKHYAYGESFDYDAVDQVQRVKMFFQRLDAPHIDRTVPLSLRFFFPEELLTLLHYNGFVVEERFGDFDGAQLSPYSDSQIIVAHRRPEARMTASRTTKPKTSPQKPKRKPKKRTKHLSARHATRTSR